MDALASALSYPAIIVLDEFRPWHLHFFARDAVQKVLELELQDARAPMVAALAEVYCLRPDLQAAFGGPAELRAYELVRWAASAVENEDPSLIGALPPYADALQRLAAAPPPRQPPANRLGRRIVRRLRRSF